MHLVSAGQGSPEERRAAAERMRRWGPPDNVVPSDVGHGGGVLVRTADLAVSVERLQAAPQGLGFALVVRLRRALRPPSSLFDQVGHSGLRRGTPGVLLLGVEYADGRRAVSDTPIAQLPALDEEDDGTTPLLVSSGGGGSDREHTGRYWLSPLPEQGLTVVCSWPAQGIDEARLVLGGAAVREAATRAVELWPWQPPEEPDPVEPDLPTTGWFRRR